ncbi:MAG: HK97 gp10 family phage protein [Chlorobiaceae bacterium]|nr:HK97 gp10 family phage protein [Chlorobiaceae bacterium]
MITGEIIKGEDLGARFAHAGPFMTTAVHKAVMRVSLKLVSRVKEKLSGEVLNVRTGRLRRSIHAEYEFGPTQAIAVVGTNVEYGRIHEFGGVIRPKTKKALRFQIDGRWIVTKMVRMPERSFLRSSMRELAPGIREEIRRAAVASLSEIQRG